ncbi:MAG: cytochrome C [Candidatus Aminicenantes bacterium]|nr:cytochrome C [Candidatus Aminicenantes bacterium]
MKIFYLIFALLIVLNLPLVSQDSCITTKCHKDFKAFKSLHAPVEEDCTNCHEQVEKHKFKFDDRENLCIQCHDDKKEGKVVHEAVGSGSCTDCHDPHGNKYSSLLKEDRIDKVCFECHDQDEMVKKFIHGPMESGECTMCHDAHTSANAKLLKSPQGKLCTECHEDKDISKMGKNVHAPMEEGCSECHNPHSSEFEHQLKTEQGKVCAECHDDIVEKSLKAKVQHKPLNEGRKCGNCHDPHGTGMAKLLKTDLMNVCLNCHKKPLENSPHGKYNIADVLKKNKFKHGPVEDGECGSCHNAHGSDHFRLLINTYPEKMYTKYDKKSYLLCFECHDDSIARTAKTVALTDFRDDDKNLHFVHVNKEKGRTCRFCHEVHASNSPKQIREKVKFGKWELPIGFKKTSTGGSCAPGCHKPYTYSRKEKK